MFGPLKKILKRKKIVIIIIIIIAIFLNYKFINIANERGGEKNK